MRIRYIHIAVFILSFCFVGSSYAQIEIEDNEGEFPLLIDSTEIREASFDAEALRELRESSRYNYDLDPKYEDDFLKRMITWFINWLESIWPDEAPGGFAFGNIFKILGVIVAVAAIIWILAKSKMSWILKPKKAESKIELEEIDVEVADDTLQAARKAAIEQGQYRLALRYDFILLLKALEQGEVIRWKKAKTNYEYLDEIEDSNCRQQFKEAVYIYEHVWYGDFEVENLQKYKAYSRLMDNVKIPTV